MRLILERNTNALVLNSEGGETILAGQVKLNGAALGRVLGGIGEQVGENMLHQGRIHFSLGAVSLVGEGNGVLIAVTELERFC